MFRIVFTALVVLLLAALATPQASAIEVAVPSDFPAYDLWDNDPGNQGYYFTSTSAYTPPLNKRRPYAYILDARGNLIWYRTDDNHHVMFPHWTNGQIVLIRKDDDIGDRNMIVLDNQYQVQRYVAETNPFRPTMELDVHEAQITPDGHLHTLWLDPVPVDLSEWAPGAPENAVVRHNTIQEWDMEGNLVWEWRSVDHVDRLPYTGLNGDSALYDPSPEHLHTNSFQILDDGDYLVNARNMDLTFRIDRATGDVEWRLGGLLNEFEFTSGLDLPDDVPLDFTRAHDGRMLDNGHVTVYDNGILHDPFRAYAREYVLDTDTMTAELVWVYWHPDDFIARGQGSHRVTASGNHLIGWGHGGGPEYGPTVSATEVDIDGNIIWQIRVYNNAEGEGLLPTMYRMYPMADFTPEPAPYLSKVGYYDPAGSTLELVANWFGHEDEVAGYEVYVGPDEDSMELQGVSEDGVWLLEDVNPLMAYVCQVIPVDGNGDPAGPPSNVITAAVAPDDLVLDAPATIIPAGGGNLVYSAMYTSTASTTRWFSYDAKVVLPSGVYYGPILQQQFPMQPHSIRQVDGITQYVPAMAPPGQYEYIGSVSALGGPLLTRDSFLFGKAGTVTDGWQDQMSPSDWPASNLSGFHERPDVAGAEAAAPDRFELKPAYPNPFNPSTTIAVSLPEAAELTVTVHTITGREAARLARGSYGPGEHRFEFDASGLASGLYFVRAHVPGELDRTRKLVLLR